MRLWLWRLRMNMENLISRIDLARQLGVQAQTIARWEREGKFPHPMHRISPRLIYYDRTEVSEALAARSSQHRP